MRTAIVGVGNSLMQDEGVGVHVARALADETLPEGVEVIDAGTDPDVVFHLAHFDRLIVVDAAEGGEAPGTVYRFSDEIGFDIGKGRQACHDVGLLQTLRMITGSSPEVVIFGVEAESIDWGSSCRRPFDSRFLA